LFPRVDVTVRECVSIRARFRVSVRVRFALRPSLL